MAKNKSVRVERPASVPGSKENPSWFSRDNETSRPHEEAHARYLAAHGPEVRKQRADERFRPTPTTHEEAEAQIKRLDERLGVNVGAVKERAKLQLIISQADGQTTPPRTTRSRRTNNRRKPAATAA